MQSHYKHIQDLFKENPNSQYVVLISIVFPDGQRSTIYGTSNTPTNVLNVSALKEIEEVFAKDPSLPETFTIVNVTPICRDKESEFRPGEIVAP